MIGFGGRNGQESRDGAQERARQERLDVLAGTRGDEEDHALRRRDLKGIISDLITRIVVAELKKRGL